MSEFSASEALHYLAECFDGTLLTLGDGDPTPYGLTLDCQGIPLRVDIMKRPSGTLRVIIDTDGALPAGIRIRGETWFSRLTERLGAQDFQVGDPEVDDALRIDGTFRELLLFLEPETLRQLKQAVEEFELELDDGNLRGWVRSTEDGGRGIVGVEALVRLAAELCVTAGADRSFEVLAETLRSSPAQSLREACYDVLIRDQHQDPRLADLDRLLLRDSNTSLVVRAARRIGAESIAALELIVLSETRDRGERMEALVVITELRQAERARAFLLDSLASDDSWLVDAASQTIAQTQDPEWIAELVGTLGILGPTWFGRLLGTLATMPALEVDRRMASQLPKMNPTQQSAMLGVLGRIGSLRVIEDIEAWAATPEGEALAKEAAKAVQRIRRRGDIDPEAVGALSMLDEEQGGSLSMAGAEGQVSLTDPESES